MLGVSHRFFTTNDKDGDDPFGLNYDPGNYNLGKDLPPNYVRDKATGKFTGEIVNELSPHDDKLLKLDDASKEHLLVEKLAQKWKKGEVDAKAVEAGEIVQAEEMALNTLGRKPSVQFMRDKDDYDDDQNQGFSKRLTPSEFVDFHQYMEKTHNMPISVDDIPVMDMRSSPTNEENPDLDLQWISTAAQREMNGFDSFDPLADLVPQDMNPVRLVNRRKAKYIPKELLHHNNLALLRRYSTPGGCIMSRAQSRLGAKDQRKVAKLIKRARALGLIPYGGQWKYENHGNRHEPDIDQEREWEQELIKRGLVTRE
jgi:ribosomal protein S18